MDKKDQALQLFQEGYACSQSILLAFAEEAGIDRETAKRISSAFGGGMGRLRKTCGVLTGAFMVLGLKYGNTEPHDMESKLHTYRLVQEFARRFKEKHGETDCGKLLAKHISEQEVEQRQHHRKICDVFVGDGAEILSEMLDGQ